MMAKHQKIALVTGGNKGIGLALVRQLAKSGAKAILSARDETRGLSAQAQLADEGFQVDCIKLDVTNQASVQASAELLRNRYGRLDVLINNAGILPDADSSVLTIAPETVQAVFTTNTLGPMMVTQAMLPLLQESADARVINISSGLGQLSGMTGGYPAYRVSKAALNALTRIMAAELQNTRVTVNAVCPGWVRTDMGGPNAERSPEESAMSIVAWVLADASRPTGMFLRDGKVLDW
jgi:NAD(P)-dependent dehydrogenase (short-subunit alcohol dehydrogenase family)